MNGVSAFDMVEAAIAQDHIFRRRRDGSPYRYVAVLDIPEATAVECDDELGNQHHWDLYATPEDLVACVTNDVIPL